MAIIPETPGEIDTPNSLTSEAAGTVAIPNLPTAETEGQVSIPNLPTAETEGQVAIPNSPTAKAAGSVAIPNSLTPEAAGQVSIPNSLTPEAAGQVSIPNLPTAETEGQVAIPNLPTAESAGTVAIPNSLTSQPASVLPRALCPLLSLSFSDDSYAQCGQPRSFDDVLTYSRPSNGSFINQRVDCGTFEYFLDTDVVGSVENLATFSEQFDDADWNKVNVTLTVNNENDSQGVKTADKLQPTTTGTLRGVDQSITLTTANHTVSFEVKSDGFNWVRILDAAGTNSAWFNVLTGVVGTVSGGAETKIEPLADDWYRCSIADAGAVSGTADIILADADNSTTATVNGNDGILISRAQTTLGLKPLPYVQTLTVPVTKVFAESLRIEFDQVTGENLGALLEGATTNLYLRSEEFDNASWSKISTGSALAPVVTPNVAIAPDDTTSADRIVFDLNGAGAGSRSFIRQTLTVINSGPFTSGFWIKSNTGQNQQLHFHVNGSDGIAIIATSEWQMISESGLNSSTSNNAGLVTIGGTDPDIVDVLVWGAQFGELPFPTSYNRTEGSTVSRAADLLTVPVAGNEVSDFSDASYNINMDFIDLPAGGSSSSRVLFKSAPTSGNSLIRVNSAGALETFHGSLGPDIAADGAFNESLKVTTTYEASTNLIKGYIDGAELISTDAGTAFIPDVSGNIGIGSLDTGGENLFGHIKDFSIYDVTLTATEVSQL